MSSHLLTLPFGFLLRIVQILIHSSLYLVIGLLTAGGLRAMVGPERLRALFGTGRWAAPLRAWAAATTLLPVCSLGVLPVLRELRRAGVSRPAVLTFALAAPMLNPISLIYGVSYLGPSVLGILILGTSLVSVGVGVLWGYLRPGDLIPDRVSPEGRVPSVGLRRVTAAAVHAARESLGPTASDVACGVLGAALIASLVFAPSLSASVFAEDPLAVPRMMAVAPGSYLSPDQAVAIVPEMLKFRQSSGAMFVLVALGAGMTLGHPSWIARAYGWRSALLWMVLASGLTLATAYGIGGLIPPVGTPNDDNDHLAVMANPLEGVTGLTGVRDVVVRDARGLGMFHVLTSGGLLGLVFTGLLLRKLGGRGSFESYLSSPGASKGETGSGRPRIAMEPPASTETHLDARAARPAPERDRGYLRLLPEPLGGVPGHAHHQGRLLRRAGCPVAGDPLAPPRPLGPAGRQAPHRGHDPVDHPQRRGAARHQGPPRRPPIVAGVRRAAPPRRGPGLVWAGPGEPFEVPGRLRRGRHALTGGNSVSRPSPLESSTRRGTHAIEASTPRSSRPLPVARYKGGYPARK